MSADLLTASLLRIAVEDLAAVRLLAPSNNRNAAYLLEQAARTEDLDAHAAKVDEALQTVARHLGVALR